jgi:hypothetical protein
MFQKVCEYINENNIYDIKQVIRKIVFPKVPEDQVPLSNIKIHCIDMMDYSSIPDCSKYLLQIGKEKDDKERNIVHYIDTEGIITFVAEEQEKGKNSVEAIFEREKNNKNPLFEHVMFLRKGKKYLFEVSISLFVDYSFSV